MSIEQDIRDIKQDTIELRQMMLQKPQTVSYDKKIRYDRAMKALNFTRDSQMKACIKKKLLKPICRFEGFQWFLEEEVMNLKKELEYPTEMTVHLNKKKVA